MSKVFTPVARSPLAHLELGKRARKQDERCAVWANELPVGGYISLRGEATDAAFLQAVAGVLGGALPTVPCTFALLPKAEALWLGPDEWMLLCAHKDVAALVAALEGALAGIHHQVADNSGGYTRVTLRGSKAATALAHVSVYDYASLAEGRVVGSTFGKSSAYIRRDGEGYLVLFRRSFAEYIWKYLERAATPYGFGVCTLEPASAPARAKVAA
ncbi:sarcosine oxidase subunit gamma [Derxia gummosa]|uniref:Sarcosine oxidase subunit gamma n=1 Tax=Derxia gummosa DSM 723 TaxID=1121388 RepID=A0A8B6X2B0_9BURK|nr:sarcosine oxidase subunit gamma family protein [Derxia gummosa]